MTRRWPGTTEAGLVIAFACMIAWTGTPCLRATPSRVSPGPRTTAVPPSQSQLPDAAAGVAGAIGAVRTAPVTSGAMGGAYWYGWYGGGAPIGGSTGAAATCPDGDRGA